MSSHPEYDVIVVGAGPGGSSTALELARFGHRVLMLEKQKMPRAKICGGCLSARLQTIIDDDLGMLAEAVTTKVELTFRGKHEITVESRDPLAYMVMRDKFDLHRARRAEAAGAEVHEAEPVSVVKYAKHRFEVRTTKGIYYSRFLVGADGVNGIASQQLGYRPKRQIAVALEDEVKMPPDTFAGLRGTIRLDIGEIPYGYGWIFPKKDHYSIGVGSAADLDRHPRSYYIAFLENQNIRDRIESESLKGFRLPLFSSRKSQIVGSASLLVGDAAALVDPFLGEGVFYAIRSGQIAADTIHQSLSMGEISLAKYQERISAEIYPELEAAARFAKFAYQFNRMGYALFKAHPEAADDVGRILKGTLSYREYWTRVSALCKYGLFGFLKLLKRNRARSKRTYNQIAAQYDALHFYWQETIARESQNYFDSFLKQHVRDGATVLDAGTGTGESIRRLLQIAKPGYVTGLDISERMLDLAAHKIKHANVHFQQGDFLNLPFPDRSFDVVMSSWAIETCPNPRAAVSEFLRVIKEDGFVIYVFSTLPNGIKRLYSYAIEKFLGSAFDWHFLNKREQPFHECKYSSLTTFADGLITVVVLRKCCTVANEAVCSRLPAKWSIQRELMTRTTRQNQLV